MAGSCYLVRHAAAMPSSPQGDSGRPLSPEGQARFRAMLQTLGAELTIDRILTSPLARAKETARLLSVATGASVEEDAELASGASAATLLQRLRTGGAGVAVVGHNPEISEAIAAIRHLSQAVSPGTIAAVAVDDAGLRLRWLRSP